MDMKLMQFWRMRLTKYRGINAGSKYDMEDFCAALDATQTPLGDLIDRVFTFEQAEEAVDYVWQGKQIGKIVLRV
jgi:threonine dehydrogenase-like Zn-dependent dehydrogenase